MCVVSMIGDHYGQKWPQQYPSNPWTLPGPATTGPITPTIPWSEFDSLRKDVQEMKELLKKAKAYDIANGEPECELEEKYELIRKVAKYVGVEIEDVIGKGKE